ncbi:MAG: electron transport complex subunit RsxA [Candidatus Margulisbacteria bacterium]|nr:electron transport complex subunit RsxA [Candidatus Margulisiibacteriota bacterium]
MDIKLVLIFLSTILANNFVLTKFLGICPFIGVSKHIESALGMGLAVIFVMTLASITSWLIQYYLLIPLNIQFLQTVFFILVIASLVQFIEMVIKKTSPALEATLGVYLPLITTNCAILGVAILNINDGYSLIQSIVSGFGSGLGFTLALLLMAGIRERLEKADIPTFFKGTPIAFVTASLLAVAFLGFSGLIQF